MPNPINGKQVILGITGSIACHKGVDLASKLTQAGAAVHAILTRGAMNFVTPLALQSITHQPVITDLFEPRSEMGIDHVSLARRVDLVVIAPATAHTMAKVAYGLCDDALSTTILATTAPVLFCPAMDGNMWDNRATQDNVKRLISYGYIIAGPAAGHLGSGIEGIGRLIEVPEIMGYIRLVLGKKGDLLNKRIVVSAGGTQEAIDPVRYISNRSSGKMGYAIAEAARDRGAEATLVTAPTSLPDPVGVRVIHVKSAMEMHDAIIGQSEHADALIMAAAVADWRPVQEAKRKIKKGASDSWEIKLTRNPDILSDVKSPQLIKVGFAAETEDLLSNAGHKLREKGLHIIVANDVSEDAGVFGSDLNKVTILDRDGVVESLEMLSKYEVGHHILDRIAALWVKPNA